MAKRLDGYWKNRSISHATMREEDLIPTFVEFLENAKRNGVVLNKTANATLRDAKTLISQYRSVFAGDSSLTFSRKTQEKVSYITEELFDVLGDIAPAGCYFGAHPGDGSDYGFCEIDEDW